MTKTTAKAVSEAIRFTTELLAKETNEVARKELKLRIETLKAR